MEERRARPHYSGSIAYIFEDAIYLDHDAAKSLFRAMAP